MTTGVETAFLSEVESSLPFLRRHARSLTGSQRTGDAYAAATLEVLVEDPSVLKGAPSTRLGLYTVFHKLWTSAGAPVEDAETGLLARAQANMSGFSDDMREALLLHVVEGFDLEQVGVIMDVTGENARHLVESAREEMKNVTRGRILIIEDEPVIALDLENIVTDAGHTVCGTARTHSEAIAVAGNARPDLILADIQLADESSGIDAVNELLARHGETPVIFITAFPERLLTGKKPEPAFLITKPFHENHVLSAVSQAMFFASTSTLVDAAS